MNTDYSAISLIMLYSLNPTENNHALSGFIDQIKHQATVAKLLLYDRRVRKTKLSIDFKQYGFLDMDLCNYEMIDMIYDDPRMMYKIINKSTKINYLSIHCLKTIISEKMRDTLLKTTKIKTLVINFYHNNDCQQIIERMIDIITNNVKRDTLSTLKFTFKNYDLYGIDYPIKIIKSCLKSSRHPFKIIVVYIARCIFDDDIEFVIKSPNYNYCSNYIHEIIYYRSLFLQGRCDREIIDPCFEFVCCYAPMWIVIQVCFLLKNYD